ncbi:hypothetical protein NUW58_g1317 [Xylaria curta]|uniref:Uncharacterized protein n=1 Tax=Xylaria curta TaxID=42375 RepID=A0ACC1PP39_9PEZI|nr:hypothetical protein NUW58_g1317 [Xylaria curta]
MPQTGKRIVFTGGSGKAGRHVLPELLKRGHKILNVDLVPLPNPDGNGLNPDICTLKTDLTDSGQVFNALTSHFNFDGLNDGRPPGPPDVVIHFAAHARILLVPDNECYKANVVSTYNVIEAASKLGVKKIIIASSETVYGVCFAEGDIEYDHFPLSEDDDVNPMDSYAISKLCGERVARGFARRFGNDIYALRIGNVVEPHEYERDFPRHVGQPETRKRNAWSYIDARDLGQICDLCIQKDGLGFQVFNATNDTITTLEPTLQFLEKAAPATAIAREMGEYEAPLSNRKAGAIGRKRTKQISNANTKYSSCNMPRDYPLHDTVIIIPEEDDIDDVELSGVEQGLRSLQNTRSNGGHIPLIDLTQDEQAEEIVHDYELQIIRELERAGSGRRRRLPALRNPPIPAHLQFDSLRHLGMLIKRGSLVEVPQRGPEEYKWQFIHVSEIYIDTPSRNVTLRGIRLTRNRHMRGLLPRFKNEVCALYDVNKEDGRQEHIQAAVQVPVAEVIRIRALFRTNDAFPSHRFDRRQWETVEEIEDKAGLVQRWKHYRYWPTAEAMATKKSYSGAVVRLRSSDIEDKFFRVADDQLRNEFRGGIVRGGSYKGGQVVVPTINLDATKGGSSISTLEYSQRYTANDMFSGAGGASCGIRQAGLQVRIACDMDYAAAKSYKKNFPETTLKMMNIFSFIEEPGTAMVRADVTHISPPCQVFSPAHTIAGKNDDANAAALFATGEVLKKCCPRISTGEQTFGLLFDRNQEFFNALVGQHTALGFSFSWDILQFKEYGVPSFRRRLVWVASCPGEALPPFPAPTHAEPVTLRDVFAKINHRRWKHDPLHNVKDMVSKAAKCGRFPKKPYSDRCQVGTVTTSGSEWAHPSGKRNFTLRELACIQGFPMKHKFSGTVTQINRQIGNAFPPVVVKTLYSHIRNWLLYQDRIMTAAVRVEDVILVDPEDVSIVDLTDVVEDHPTLSRESSRTLSAESLPSLMEMEIDNDAEGGDGRTLRHVRCARCAPRL